MPKVPNRHGHDMVQPMSIKLQEEEAVEVAAPKEVTSIGNIPVGTDLDTAREMIFAEQTREPEKAEREKPLLARTIAEQEQGKLKLKEHEERAHIIAERRKKEAHEKLEAERQARAAQRGV